MKCPMCGKWTSVIDSRAGLRRRECGNEHRFSTQEVVFDVERSAPAETRRIAADMKKAVRVVWARATLRAKGYLRD